MAAIPTVVFSEVERLILRAALLEGDAARAAYHELHDGFDLDALDFGRQRLLPLLHRNITTLGIADPELGRIRGARHFHWARNQVRIRALGPILAAFRQAGIPTTLLKGAALLASAVDDMSLRPMDDSDVLVPYEDRARAVDILVGLGLRPVAVPVSNVLAVEQFGPGCAFEDARGNQLDLHWRVFHLDARPGADAPLWQRRRRVRFAGETTAVLDWADQLLHAIAHGALWAKTATTRWAADAVLILRRAGADLAWDRFAGETIARRLAPPVHAALTALAEALDLALPPEPLRALARHCGPFAKVPHRLRAKPNASLSPAARWLLRLDNFRRRDERLMRRPLPAALLPAVRDWLEPAQPARPWRALLFYALGRPRRLRRALAIDALPEGLSPEALPPIADARAGTGEPLPPSAYIAGWSWPEANGRWSVHPEARLGFRLPRPARGLALAIDAMPFWFEGAAGQTIDVFANGVLVDRWRLDRSAAFSIASPVRIPDPAVRGREALVVTFSNRGLRAPADRARSADFRPLFLFLRRASVAPAAGPVADRNDELVYPLRSRIRRRIGADGLWALPGLGLFEGLGQPRVLRRLLAIDRRARFDDPDTLPLAMAPEGEGAQAPAFTHGWSGAEAGSRWSVAREARLVWRLPEDWGHDLVCEIDAWPARPPGRAPPAVEIFANDWPVARWSESPAGAYRRQSQLQIPAAAVAGSPKLVLTLVVDRLTTLSVGGKGADARRLGVFVRHVALARATRPAPYAPAPTRLGQYCRDRFGARGIAAAAALRLFDLRGRRPADRVRFRIDRWARFVDTARLPLLDEGYPAPQRDPCLEGWWEAEPGGRWLVAREARAAWLIAPDRAGPLECEIEGWTLHKPGLPPPVVTVRANDRDVARWHGGPAGDSAIVLRFGIPAAAVAGAETLVLGFEVDPLRSPAELGISDDRRSLGIFLTRVRFRPGA